MLQSLQEIKHTVRNASMCHPPSASEQNVVYYSLKECWDFWALFKRFFFCSFPLVLIATSECMRGFVCTETCKLICPLVNQYKIHSTRRKKANPADTFLTCCLVKMTFTNLFSRKVLIWKKLLTQINDRNNNGSLSTSIESKQWRFVSANFCKVIWPVRQVCESLPRVCFYCTNLHMRTHTL